MVQTKPDTSSSLGLMRGLLLWVNDGSARFATATCRQCPQEFHLIMPLTTTVKYDLPSTARSMQDRAPAHFSQPMGDVFINTYYYRTGPVLGPHVRPTSIILIVWDN